MNRNLKITLVELPATVDGRLNGKLARDIYSLLMFPARGLPTLEAILRANGYADVVSIDPEYTHREGHLNAVQWKRLAESDVVGISAITRTANQSYELGTRVRSINPRATIIFGGPHTTALPEEGLQYGDLVVLHEGDYTVLEILKRLAEHRERPDWSNILGLAYRDRDGQLHQSPDRPFLTSEELSRLPFPVLAPEVIRGITCHVITTSRGCPFECEFCSVIENFGKQFRFMDDDSTIELIRHTLRYGPRKPIFFGDDIFTSNRARVKRILSRLLSMGVRMPRWFAQVRIESAGDKELLEIMRRANCSTAFIGLESVNEETLKLYNKHATVERNRQAIEAYHAAGIKVHGMFVLGSDADTVDTVWETLAFAKRMRLDTAQFFALTVVPGPPLTRRLYSEGRVINWGQWHLYDAQHASVQAKKISPLDLQESVLKASLGFYSVREAFRRLLSGNHRFYNFAIRLQGKILARRILRDNQDYIESLRRLHTWHQQLEEESKVVIESARRRLAELGTNLEAQRARVQEYVSETTERCRASIAQLPVEFGPFCREWVDRTSAQLHKRLESALNSLEWSAPGPTTLTSEEK